MYEAFCNTCTAAHPRAVMAAAAFSSSRTTKGLFLIFTVLSLVCFTNSLIDKERLEKLKEEYEELQTKMDQVKADYMAGKEEIEELRKAMDQFLLSDFPPFIGNKKQFLEELTVDVSKDYDDDNLGKNIESLESILTQIDVFIKFLERNQASFKVSW